MRGTYPNDGATNSYKMGHISKTTDPQLICNSLFLEISKITRARKFDLVAHQSSPKSNTSQRPKNLSTSPCMAELSRNGPGISFSSRQENLEISSGTPRSRKKGHQETQKMKQSKQYCCFEVQLSVLPDNTFGKRNVKFFACNIS